MGINEVLTEWIRIADASPTLAAFWGGVASSLVVGAIFWLILPKLLYTLRRPKLNIKFIKTLSNELHLIRREDGTFGTTFRLYLSNQSNLSFTRKIYWHLVIPESIEVKHEMTDDAKKIASVQDRGREGGYRHYSGHLDAELYAKNSLEIPVKFEISGSADSGGEHEMLYWLKTEYGSVPASMSSTDEINMREHKKLPRLKLILPALK